MKIVVYGLSITSSWGNGHATTYRSLLKALARRGHTIEFVEKDVEWYRSHRDLPEPEFCNINLYDEWEPSADWLIGLSKDADAIVVGSYFPDAIPATKALLEAGAGPVMFYDIDTPVTLAALRRGETLEYLSADLIPSYSAYLSFTGGPVLTELETTYHSPRAIAFYCSVDPELYHPLTPSPQYCCDLSYLGTYAPDRQDKLMQLLNGTAGLLPQKRFTVAGSMYPADTTWQGNVHRINHLPPPEHPVFYSSSRFTLNLTRADMVAAGYSPSVRLFEAAACGAAIISDRWVGIDHFLTPGEEILLPNDQYEVADLLANLPDHQRRSLGSQARDRILDAHTASHRAAEFESIVAALA